MDKILIETLDHLQQSYETNVQAAKELAEKGALLKLTVKQEENTDCFNPRDWGNLGVMLCKHRRYALGDKHKIDVADCNGWDEVKEKIMNAVILPLYLYDHSGITISTKPFNDVFDSRQVGFIYAARNSEGLTVEQITDNLEGEVDLYDKYLRGEVYCYTITNQITNEMVAECGGFFSEKEAQEEGETALLNSDF